MSNKLKVNLLGLITVFFWGASYPVTKIALQSFTSLNISFIRCFIAASLLTVVGLATKNARLPKVKDLPLFVLCGGVGFAGYLITYSQGLVTLPSGTSSLLVATSPIITAIYTSIFWGEKIRPLGWVSIFCAFGGVAMLLVWGSGISIAVGTWWTLGAALVFAIYNLTSRRLAARGYGAIETLIICIWLGAACLSFRIPPMLAELRASSLSSILAALFLSCFPSCVSYLCWNKALSLAERTNDVTNYMFVTPVFSTLIGVLLLWEIPPMSTFVGGAVVIGSIIAFNKLK